MNPLNSDTRIAVLACLCKMSPGLGRTQLMKLVYFLQELKGVELGYDFRLFNFGPFDSELLSDLATSCALGAVMEETVLFSLGYGYSIKPGLNTDRFVRDLKDNQKEIASKIDDIVRDFGSFGAAELELRSTIFFVDREFASEEKKGSADTVVERVRQIKPRFDNATILKRVTEMAEKFWLQSVDFTSSHTS